MLSLAADLDRTGHHDLADVLDRVSETRPANQPQIQQLDPALTTMRGPAGWALLEDDERQAELEKQVKPRPPRKVRPRSHGLSVGVDVLQDTGRRRTPPDDRDR